MFIIWFGAFTGQANIAHPLRMSLAGKVKNMSNHTNHYHAKKRQHSAHCQNPKV